MSLQDGHAPSSVVFVVVVVHNLQTSSPLKTAGPIKDKLHVEYSCEGGMKVCINCSGHMTKLTPMAINSTNLLKRF